MLRPIAALNTAMTATKARMMVVNTDYDRNIAGRILGSGGAWH
jgi:hypothetical protein